MFQRIDTFQSKDVIVRLYLRSVPQNYRPWSVHLYLMIVHYPKQEKWYRKGKNYRFKTKAETAIIFNKLTGRSPNLCTKK